MTLWVQVHLDRSASSFERGEVVHIGRSDGCEIHVGHEHVQGRWTVSKLHAELGWDGSRWSTSNVSDKPGLFRVYEPGYEEVLLEPGRVWVPVRHRWSYGIGRPDHRFEIVCRSDEHEGPAVMPDAHRRNRREAGQLGVAEDEPTATLERILPFRLTPLEHDVLFAYYADFTRLPRPAILEPRSHEDAARQLGRSRDSTRKAIERVNEKIGRAADAPPIATGRNVSAEVGRWLARAGLIDPTEDVPPRGVDETSDGR